jgi:hypothetical protein
MKRIHFLSLFVAISIVSVACSSKKASKDTTLKQEPIPMDFSGPPTIIYKTNADYSKLVPVILSDDKSKIISYPSPTDIYYKGQLAYPTKLNNGYYLDNRGLTKNSVFLNITYEEYAKLKEVPLLKELYAKISDKNPFTEFYDCGNRHRLKNEVEEINKIIDGKKLKDCKCMIPASK